MNTGYKSYSSDIVKHTVTSCQHGSNARASSINFVSDNINPNLGNQLESVNFEALICIQIGSSTALTIDLDHDTHTKFLTSSLLFVNNLVGNFGMHNL